MKRLLTVSLFFFLASCAHNDLPDPIDYMNRDFVTQDSDRLIYRDLTVSTSQRSNNALPQSDTDELAAITASMRESDQQPVLPAALPKASSNAEVVSVAGPASEPFYIPFYNESSVLPSERLPVLRDIVSHHEDGKRYVVMGHSHGHSLVGTARLAQKRAETVTNWMISQGIDKTVIHQTASWSEHRDPLAPPKGVMVYVVGEQNGRYLLSLTPFDFEKESEYEQPQLAAN